MNDLPRVLPDADMSMDVDMDAETFINDTGLSLLFNQLLDLNLNVNWFKKRLIKR